MRARLACISCDNLPNGLVHPITCLSESERNCLTITNPKILDYIKLKLAYAK